MFVTPKGAILIDTDRPGWGPSLREKIITLTERPVTTIINTHSHAGHVSGNIEFPTAKEIVAHANALTNLKKLPEFRDGRGLPNRTFTDQLTIGQGADRVELYFLGRGQDTLAKALTVFAGRVDRIVTGHGAMATMNDLREHVDFCREFAAAVRAGKIAGRSAADIAKSWSMPSKYTGYAVPAPDLVMANVQTVFGETK